MLKVLYSIGGSRLVYNLMIFRNNSYLQYLITYLTYIDTPSARDIQDWAIDNYKKIVTHIMTKRRSIFYIIFKKLYRQLPESDSMPYTISEIPECPKEQNYIKTDDVLYNTHNQTDTSIHLLDFDGNIITFFPTTGGYFRFKLNEQSQYEVIEAGMFAPVTVTNGMVLIGTEYTSNLTKTNYRIELELEYEGTTLTLDSNSNASL